MTTTMRPEPLIPSPKVRLTPREPRAPVGLQSNPAVDVRGFSFFYGPRQALKNLNFTIERKAVTAIIGPSGCGKSTFLRSINRLNDLIPGARHGGTLELDGEDVYERGGDVVALRQRAGMVFQRWNPFPKTIYDYVAFGPRING